MKVKVKADLDRKGSSWCFQIACFSVYKDVIKLVADIAGSRVLQA